MRNLFLLFLLILSFVGKSHSAVHSHCSPQKGLSQHYIHATPNVALSVNYSYNEIEDDDKNDETIKEYLIYHANQNHLPVESDTSPSLFKKLESSHCPFYILFHSLKVHCN